MKAWAIKGPKGLEVDTTRDSGEECWSNWMSDTHMSDDDLKGKGYTCVEVEVTEGDEAVRLLAALREHFKTKYVVGDEIYAEIDAFEKEMGP